MFKILLLNLERNFQSFSKNITINKNISDQNCYNTRVKMKQYDLNFGN